jgi:HEAT repeat protein
MNPAESKDAALIVGALAQTQTSNVRFTAALAAGTVLEVEPDAELVAALARVALDAAAKNDERRAAASALGRALSPAATEALIQVSRDPDLRLQASAALDLLDRDPIAHRIFVEELVRTWPNDPPYPAQDVLDLLAELSAED